MDRTESISPRHVILTDRKQLPPQAGWQGRGSPPPCWNTGAWLVTKEAKEPKRIEVSDKRRGFLRARQNALSFFHSDLAFLAGLLFACKHQHVTRLKPEITEAETGRGEVRKGENARPGGHNPVPASPSVSGRPRPAGQQSAASAAQRKDCH